MLAEKIIQHPVDGAAQRPTEHHNGHTLPAAENSPQAERNFETGGFSKLDLEDRMHRLVEAGLLTEAESRALQGGNLLRPEVADSMIENNIGRFELPMGIAVGVPVNGKELVVPMCVEETSVVAAVCKTARWARETGVTRAEVLGREVTGQIHIPYIADFRAAQIAILHNKVDLISLANQQIPGMVARGGGVRSIELRRLDRADGDGSMGSIDVRLDACDAMGANAVTQICEFLKPHVEHLLQERAGMCIVSNLSDGRLVRAEIQLFDIDKDLALGVEEASDFAAVDPYRAATHNKGIMNGIDPILIATGNDWRAAEAGAHAYAARNGQYAGLSQWHAYPVADSDKAHLHGTLVLPMAVGTVGGVTKTHPAVQLALRMMDVQSADELAEITATVGLLQNLGALRALTTKGIIEGHMRLHAKNIINAVETLPGEHAELEAQLKARLKANGRISHSDALEILAAMRS